MGAFVINGGKPLFGSAVISSSKMRFCRLYQRVFLQTRSVSLSRFQAWMMLLVCVNLYRTLEQMSR